MLSWRRKWQKLSWLVLFAAAVAQGADHNKDKSDVSHLVPPSGVTIDQAVARARSAYGGRVLSVTEVERSGTDGFEIRLLIEGGRVKTVFVDELGRMSGK